MPRAWYALIGFIVGVGALACVHPTPSNYARSDSVTASADSDSTVVEIQNNSTFDVRIYLLRGDMPTRLGLVNGMSTARFPLTAESIKTDIRFYASPVGSATRLFSDAVLLHPGQFISWRLHKDLRSGNLAIW